MTPSFNTFQLLKTKGIAAYRSGDYAAARAYLLEAAERMLAIAEKTTSPGVRRQQEELASELLQVARDCSSPRARGRTRPQQASDQTDSAAEPGDWIVKDRPQVRFTDLAGLEDVKQEIRLKMIYPLQHPELAQRYGIQAGGGILLYGPPGTGKTLMAKAIAGELEATFFVISPAQILSKWVGEAEQNLMKLFDAARQEESAVIFMDEIEALVPRRQSEGSSVMQRVVPQILQELEGFEARTRPLLFVGATNRPWMLDEALCRPGRLDALIYVPLPDAPARYRLLEMYLAPRPLADDVDLGALCDSLAGYSGADIAAIAQRAARTAFLESIGGQPPRTMTVADIERAIADARPSVNQADLARFERFAETGA